MTDLSAVSDADLVASLPRGVRSNNPLNLKDTSGEFRSFPTQDEGVAAADQNLLAYNTKHGINTVSGVVNRWAPPNADGNNTGAYVTHVASRLGVDPNAPVDLKDPATRQKMLGAMAEFENGAPVLSAAKSDLSTISDADLMASLGNAAPKAPPRLPSAPIVAQRQAAPVAKPPPVSRTMDAALGASSGAGKGMGAMADQVAALIPGLGMVDRVLSGGNAFMADPLHTQGTVFQRLAKNYNPQTLLGNVAKSVGSFLPAAAVPGSIPQRIANVVLPGVGSELSAQGAKAMGGSPLVQQIARTGGAIAGGALASTRLNPSALASKPKVSLEDLKAAKTAAYQAVDNAGVAFKSSSAKGLASDISSMVTDEGGADIYPKAAAMAQRIDNVVSKGDVPLTQLDKLRAQVGEKLLSGSDQEARLGGLMRDKIDAYIDGASPADLSQGTAGNAQDLLATARDLNTRYRKVQEITDRTNSADLRAASTYAGGNQANATRQNLRPLIDPKSNQQIKNLTPDETKALNQVVRGSPAQNAMRATGKVLDPRGLLGAAFQTAMGIPSHGLSVLSAPVGMAASKASNAMTSGSVDKLIQLIANGGGKPGAQTLLGGPAQTPLLTGGSPLSEPALIAALLSAMPAMTAAKPRRPQQR